MMWARTCELKEKGVLKLCKHFTRGKLQMWVNDKPGLANPEVV